MKLSATLSWLILLGTVCSCREDKIGIQNFPPCETPFTDVRRGKEFISKVSVTIVLIDKPNHVYNILRKGPDPVPISACNLPQQFKQDSLKVRISGYYLTSPFLEVANIIPLPFEITAIELDM